MKDFLTAIALALTFEGGLYALFPSGMKRMMAIMQTRPDHDLRWAGLTFAVLGVVVVAAVRRG